MLTELSIRDLALLERADLCFGAGLNVATGETGAGKSLLIGALELLLGRRPRAHMVRRGAAEARVAGRFFFPAGAVPEALLARLAEGAPAILEEREGEDEELELVLTRTVGDDGRTRAYLNQRPVTRRFLRELAELLVEIHGQNDHQKLLEPREQLALIDAFGGLEGKLATYRERRERWLGLSRRLVAWSEEEAARRDRLDLLRFQIAELEEAELTREGVEGLRRERERLRHAEALGVEVGGLLAGLADEDGAALDVLRRADSLLERWERKVSDLAGAAEEVREATAHLQVAVARLRAVLDGLESDPDRLESRRSCASTASTSPGCSPCASASRRSGGAWRGRRATSRRASGRPRRRGGSSRRPPPRSLAREPACAGSCAARSSGASRTSGWRRRTSRCASRRARRRRSARRTRTR